MNVQEMGASQIIFGDDFLMKAMKLLVQKKYLTKKVILQENQMSLKFFQFQIFLF